MSTIESIKSLILDLPPSCVEFWPLNPQYVIVGTYNLEKPDADQEASITIASSAESESDTDADESKFNKGQQRNGSLILLEVRSDDVKIIQTLPTPSAILDLHFAPSHYPTNLFAVATSTGSIDTYQLVDAYDEAAVEPGVVPRISHVKTHQYFPEDVLVTVFSWHPTSPAVGMSLSSGEISLASTTGGTLNATVFTHDLEAWTLAFLPDGMGLYSGGDDSVLAYRDLPANFESVFETDNDSNLAEETPQWKDKRIHGAGVTGILPLHTQGERHLVLTGSYDDCIRLIDAPVSGRRKVLAEMNLGGGVWRLKRLDVSPDIPAEEQTTSSILLLASCMHAGARIVRLFRTEEEDWTFEVLAKFEEHKSMNYGSDCQPQVTEKGQRTFITTSFYDRLLCLWRF